VHGRAVGQAPARQDDGGRDLRRLGDPRPGADGRGVADVRRRRLLARDAGRVDAERRGPGRGGAGPGRRGARRRRRRARGRAAPGRAGRGRAGRRRSGGRRVARRRRWSTPKVSPCRRRPPRWPRCWPTSRRRSTSPSTPR
jgi:hypothetical protein